MSSEALDVVWREIARISTCMVVSSDGDDMRARPIVSVPDRDNRAIWFVAPAQVNGGSLGGSQKVCLTYADLTRNTFLSVVGRAHSTHDRDRLSQMVSMMSREAWSHLDPDVDPILVRVTPEVGEMWDDPQADVIAALQALTTASQLDEDALLQSPNRKVRM